MAIGFRDVKLSYEGEGDFLGVKTLFARSPGTTSNRQVVELAHKSSVGAFYFTLDENSTFQEVESFVDSVKNLLPRVRVTIEAPGLTAWNAARQASIDSVHIRFFLNFDKEFRMGFFRGFIKIRILKLEDVEQKVDLANWFARQQHDVLLMPEYPATPQEYGQVLMQNFEKIHQRVRFMPPVHKLLGIE